MPVYITVKRTSMIIKKFEFIYELGMGSFEKGMDSVETHIGRTNKQLLTQTLIDSS